VNSAVPQESGHRAGLRELVLPDLGLAVTAHRVGRELPGFSLRAHDAAEVTAARHPHELPPSRATHLYLDAQQHGLGSASCGPDVRPEYQLRPRAASWAVTLGDL
jgi:beta-galactosidase